MDEGWVSNLEVDCNESGRFVAVLVLTPPPELGPPIRVPIEGNTTARSLPKMRRSTPSPR